MTNSLVQGQDEIMEQIRLEFQDQKVSVFQGEYVPVSETVKVDRAGNFQPYIVVSFSGLYDGPDKSIVSAKYDTKRAVFQVYTVAQDDRTSQIMRDRINERLIGFEPYDGGEISQRSSYNYVDPDSIRHRYVLITSYGYLCNLIM